MQLDSRRQQVRLTLDARFVGRIWAVSRSTRLNHRTLEFL
jgi:hypothetical protein